MRRHFGQSWHIWNWSQFTVGCYQTPPGPESNPEKYMLKEDDKSGAALIFALLPTAMADDEFNEHYQKLKEDRDNGYPNMNEMAETAAILCDNLYRRIRYGTSLTVGRIPNDTPTNGSIPQLKAFTVQKGTYSPTDVILGTFQVVKPGALPALQIRKYSIYSDSSCPM